MPVSGRFDGAGTGSTAILRDGVCSSVGRCALALPWERRSNEDTWPSTLDPDSPTHKSRHDVRMWADAELWRRMVESYFGFVAGFGFCMVDVDDRSVWARWVLYRSETAGIRCR